MSYKYSILSDNPILFYQSNQVALEALSTYQNMANTYTSYTALLYSYKKYSFLLGNSINDISGCDNDGAYEGLFGQWKDLPLVCGESYAINIDVDNYILTTTYNGYDMNPVVSNFGTKYSSDNDFTLEAWVYSNIVTDNVTPLYADPTNNIGLFYDKGNILFNIGSESISYTLPYLKTRYHVVAIYNPSNISIYIDGILKSSKNISNFTFSNSSLDLQIGPTLDAQDSFLINSIALYRYSLSPNKILKHFNGNAELSINEVSFPDDGETIELFDNNISMQYRYAYPFNKSWKEFVTDDLYYDNNDESLSILKTSSSVAKTVVIEDLISLPAAYVMDSSKIEWDGDNGVSVETSIDGITWQTCLNGRSIPQYKLSSFNSTKLLYIRITLSTTDASKYIPKINNLYLAFYSNQTKYANNGKSYLSTFKNLAGISVPEISLPIKKYPILSQDYRNGIRTAPGSGFYINTTKLVKSLEFFYTPSFYDWTITTNSGIVNSISGNGAASEYSWDSTGTVNKVNISAIYIDGIDKTSQVDITEVLKENKLNHIVIVYTNPISGGIKFNYHGTEALYQNITLYDTEINATKALNHFNLYTLRPPTTVSINGTALGVTENSIAAYNNNWTVLQNV